MSLALLVTREREGFPSRIGQQQVAGLGWLSVAMSATGAVKMCVCLARLQCRSITPAALEFRMGSLSVPSPALPLLGRFIGRWVGLPHRGREAKPAARGRVGKEGLHQPGDGGGRDGVREGEPLLNGAKGADHVGLEQPRQEVRLQRRVGDVAELPEARQREAGVAQHVDDDAEHQLLPLLGRHARHCRLGALADGAPRRRRRLGLLRPPHLGDLCVHPQHQHHRHHGRQPAEARPQRVLHGVRQPNQKRHHGRSAAGEHGLALHTPNRPPLSGSDSVRRQCGAAGTQPPAARRERAR
mmetsp:Transcript_25898/g.66634  ORF Transcript_25898/g.66634 Transcript_25898/m.66634 type:complete len:298 (-) Transcript_25898:180-1073(-)